MSWNETSFNTIDSLDILPGIGRRHGDADPGHALRRANPDEESRVHCCVVVLTITLGAVPCVRMAGIRRTVGRCPAEEPAKGTGPRSDARGSRFA